MKYALLYILIAGLLLGTPGFLSVLQDEYVWGGIFISVVTYFILGLLALLTMKGAWESRSVFPTSLSDKLASLLRLRS